MHDDIIVHWHATVSVAHLIAPVWFVAVAARLRYTVDARPFGMFYLRVIICVSYAFRSQTGKTACTHRAIKGAFFSVEGSDHQTVLDYEFVYPAPELSCTLDCFIMRRLSAFV